ncbi:mycothiol system anti-sigma-R factor [Millisia brevis]|uniref:mycothiol system anti-sigma-R factor n=1 Tax=Millisia brevis TaxID=264148 RepID=UPI000834BA89|nr:mycothiol system anti-sigma-R factor [Millisia brevis]
MTSRDGASQDRVAAEQFESLDCSAMLSDIWLALDGECDERNLARLQRHLDECGHCLSVYGIESRLKEVLARKCGGERAPETLRSRLVVEIRQWEIRGGH